MHNDRVLRRTVLAGALAGIAAVGGVSGPAFAADDATGSLSGVVRDTRGAAVADAYISVYLDPAAGAVQELQAGDDGRFSVTGLQAGSYKIQIGLQGWSEWAPGRVTDPARARAYPVAANRDTTADSVITAAGVISGRFLRPDGQPASSTPVYVTNVSTGSETGGLTGADGTYRIAVQPNQTFIVGYEESYLTEYVPHTFDPSAATRYFVRSARTVRVDDQAVALSGISGRLTDAAGAPAGNVGVTFVNVDTAAESDTATAADGTYDFSGLLAPGRYKVRFSEAGHTQYAHQQPTFDDAEIITLTPGVTTVVDDQLLWTL